MSTPTQGLTKKRNKPANIAAHKYATRRKEKNSAGSWSEDERGTYWWGLYEGYQAGVLAERRRNRK